MNAKTFLILMIFMVIQSCSNHDQNSSSEINSDIKQDTIYDILRGELVHETPDTLWFEPYEEKIPKVRHIFKKGKNYIYLAVYRKANGEILSKNKITCIPSGERTHFAPERQDRVTYIFENYQEDSVKLANHSLNLQSRRWTSQMNEGVIENEIEVWIHPMRGNQYQFTEVAPYPHVKLPLEVGETWESNLNVMQGFGEWDNTSGTSSYEVVEKGFYNFDGKKWECWEIESKSIFPFGESFLQYKFSPEYGFVEMNYQNYENETLQIKLIEVEENDSKLNN